MDFSTPYVFREDIAADFTFFLNQSFPSEQQYVRKYSKKCEHLFIPFPKEFSCIKLQVLSLLLVYKHIFVRKSENDDLPLRQTLLRLILNLYYYMTKYYNISGCLRYVNHAIYQPVWHVPNFYPRAGLFTGSSLGCL